MRRGRPAAVDAGAPYALRVLLVALSPVLLAGSAQAQPASSRVVFDGSFGNPGPADTVDLGGGSLDHRIDYCAASCGAGLPGGSHGQLVGTGLFQSLEYLDLVSGDRATFAASSGDAVDNVFARVTGGETSQIWGVLESEIPGANLWLMNGEGFVFGPTSGVSVDSSFYATSADELMFADGQTFEATSGGAVPTLAVAAPASFGFWVDATAPGAIRVEGATGLAAGAGATFSLVGGRVEVSGASLLDPPPTTIQSSGGQIQLGAVPAGSGATRQVPVDLADPSLDVADLASPDAAVVFDGNANVEVSGGTPTDPGRIVIRAGRFEIDQQSPYPRGGRLRAVQTGDPSVPAIDVEVAGDLALDGAVVESSTTALAESGDIRLVGGDVVLTGASTVRGQMNITVNDFAGPDVHVEATAPDGEVRVTGGSSIQTFDDVGTGLNFGKVGDIDVLARDVTVRGTGSNVSTVSQGKGDAGTVHVDAAGVVTVDDGGVIAANRSPGFAFMGTPTDFGALRVDAAELVVRDGGQIRSETSAQFEGAAVQIGYAAPIERVEVTGGAIGSVTTGSGQGGAVQVNAGDLLVQSSTNTPERNPQISALTTRKSDGSGGDGPGGDLTITARNVTLEDGGQLRATTEGSAPGGDLTLNVAETLRAEGRFVLPDPDPSDGIPPESRPSGIFGRSQTFSGNPAPTTGPGGKVVITARDVLVRDGAEFSASAESAGPAGNLTLTAETILVEGPSTSTIATKGSQGPGGNLHVEASERLDVRDGGIITASTTGIGDAGDLVVVSPIVVISGAATGVFAQSLTPPPNPAGRAGSIDLSPPDGERLALTVTNGGAISVESRQAAAGTIAIRSADRVEVSNGGEISATVGSVPSADAGLASDITISDAGTVVVENGTIAAETLQNGRGGSIVVDAVVVDLSQGARITAESRSSSVDAGDAGSISIAASDSLSASDSTITTQAAEGAGGDIDLVGGQALLLTDGTQVSALAAGTGAAGDITVRDSDRFTLGRDSTLTAETTGPGAGGRIVIRDVRSVLLRDGAALTTRSTAADGGSAGDIVIAAGDEFEAQNASITTTAADAGGGRISIQAGKLVYLLDADVITTVDGRDPQQGDQEDAGDIDIPLRGDEVRGLETVEPQFVVINRSTIQANAVATNAGNINIAGADVLISRASVIEATSETGVSGVIRITSPDAEIVSQVTPLPADFVDPSDRLLPPCVARTERTGSFTVESRPAPPPSPDDPLAPPAVPDASASDNAPRCAPPMESL